MEHILEVHNLPTGLRSSERLLDWVGQRAGRHAAGAAVRWHDADTALLIFPAVAAAAAALPTLRPTAGKTSAPSDITVLVLRDSFRREHERSSPLGPLPGPSRRETDASVARRLIRGALGARLRTDASAARRVAAGSAPPPTAVDSQVAYLRPIAPERLGVVVSAADAAGTWRAGGAEAVAAPHDDAEQDDAADDFVDGDGDEQHDGDEADDAAAAPATAASETAAGLSASAAEWVPSFLSASTPPQPPVVRGRGAASAGVMAADRESTDDGAGGDAEYGGSYAGSGVRGGHRGGGRGRGGARGGGGLYPSPGAKAAGGSGDGLVSTPTRQAPSSHAHAAIDGAGEHEGYSRGPGPVHASPSQRQHQHAASSASAPSPHELGSVGMRSAPRTSSNGHATGTTNAPAAAPSAATPRQPVRVAHAGSSPYAGAAAGAGSGGAVPSGTPSTGLRRSGGGGGVIGGGGGVHAQQRDAATAQHGTARPAAAAAAAAPATPPVSFKGRGLDAYAAGDSVYASPGAWADELLDGSSTGAGGRAGAAASSGATRGARYSSAGGGAAVGGSRGSPRHAAAATAPCPAPEDAGEGGVDHAHQQPPNPPHHAPLRTGAATAGAGPTDAPQAGAAPRAAVPLPPIISTDDSSWPPKVPMPTVAVDEADL